MQRLFILFIVFINILISPAIAFSQPAFPGAEGFGANSIGGRGGRVIEVTNLNDSGSGSLREAVQAFGPRIVVFRISGTIALKSILRIRNPYITIAGQTAPGGGICLKDYELEINTDHVIVRYIRSRAGDNAGKENHGINIVAGKNVIIDHCSASWAVDEVLSCTTAGHDLDSVTVQWCFITESLHNSVHPKGPHGKGSLIRGSWGHKYSFHHNLYAHHDDRSPFVGNYNLYDVDKDGLIFDFRNNVIYNWGRTCGTGWEKNSKTTMNFINNYYKTGPNSRAKLIWPAVSTYCRAYFISNCMNGVYPEDTWSLISFDFSFSEEQKAAIKLSSPLQVAPVKTDDAITAYECVLFTGGATLPQRDEVDARIVNEVITGTGRIINDENEVGGWPELGSTEPPKDSDHDGIPDEWETVHDLNPNDNLDAKGTNLSQEGYTNIEVYLNELVANGPPAAVEEQSMPATLQLNQNFPNPFNQSTTISFSTTVAGNVVVTVSTVAGQKVDTLLNGFVSAGSHSVVWDPSNFSAGVYIYTVKIGEFSKTMKMTLLK